MKDISTPVPPNEVRSVIKTSLEKAALVNYERLSEEARIEAEQANPQGNKDCVIEKAWNYFINLPFVAAHIS